MRVAVDMSATLLHHGHIRLLKEARKLGTVVVLLCSDVEIEANKGYKPELNFSERKEVLESIVFVDEVIEAPWKIDDAFMRKGKLDLLLHGDDNFNDVREHPVKIVPRTLGISSSELRRRAAIILGEL